MDQAQYIINRIDQLDAKYDEKMDKILYQTTKTNGRVNNLENKVESLDKDVTTLKEYTNVNKGRDKTLWFVLVAVGALITIVIEHFISKT